MFKTPHTAIREPNPVFDFELRRIKRLAAPLRLWRYSAAVQLLPSAFLIVIYLISLNNALRQWGKYGNNGYYYYSPYYDSAALFVLILLGCAVLLAIGAGWYYLGVSVGSINRQMSSGHWEQLRVTPLAHETIYEANQALAEVRAWRVMNVEVGVRVLLVTLLGLIGTLPIDSLSRGRGVFSESALLGSLLRSFLEKPITTILDAALVLAVVVAYVCEPRWRMRTLVAMGLALSSRIRSLTLAGLAAFFGLFAFHMAQGFWLWLSGYVLVKFSDFFNLGYVSYRSYTESWLLYDLLLAAIKIGAVTAVIGSIYLFYAAVRAAFRGDMLHSAFRSDVDMAVQPISTSGAS
ncbi:MAG: hypothetical protein U0528_17035 [Anaerolineae bacterium]